MDIKHINLLLSELSIRENNFEKSNMKFKAKKVGVMSILINLSLVVSM